MHKKNIRYWGYRIATDHIGFFSSELQQGRLRQGWGWNPGQDLRKYGTSEFVDRGAAKNLRILKKVKQGHILFVPRLPDWGKVAIIRAEADFDNGYQYEIDPARKDFGHCFPAKIIGSFVRRAPVVHGDIRTTLRYRGRFWNLDVYRESINRIVEADERSRTLSQAPADGLQSAVRTVLQKASKSVYSQLDEEHEGKDWEPILAELFRALHPTYVVETVGGRSEYKHGTDILVTVPGIGANAEPDYAVAIQVKDHTTLTNDAIQQIAAAPDYWKEERGLRFVDKCIVLTRAEQDDQFVSDEVIVIWADDLREIIKQYLEQAASIAS